MKTLNILTTGAFATLLLLGSCTKDVDNPNSPGGGGEGGVVEGIPTYATVSLSQRTGAGTYADAGDYVNGNSQATAAEKKINDAAVLVFNNNDVLENFVKFENADIDAEPYAKTFATTTGKKRLYALANIGDDNYQKIEAIFNGQTAADKKLSNVCKVIQEITTIADAADNTLDQENFWMSNVYKLGATIEDQVTVLEKSQGDVVGGTDETTNNFTVYIGRMVSKVTPTFADNLVINSGDGTIEIKDERDAVVAEYRVRNNPTRFYTFPVYEGVQLVSPYYDKAYNPIDGTGVYPDALGAADFFDNGYDDGGNHTFVKIATDSYLTENSPQEAKRHKVTFLSIKAKWTPNANAIILSADGSYAANQAAALTKITSAAGAGGNDGTFYRVQKWENGLITGYCPGIYADIPAAWHEVGTAINTETKVGQLTDAAADRDEAKTKSKDVLNANKAYLVVKYTNGIAYWAYWMRSRLDGTIAEKYALKRNNHYKVNIISVDGVGEPTEDDNLDKDEDLEADTYMKATIEVLNWNVVDIEGGI